MHRPLKRNWQRRLPLSAAAAVQHRACPLGNPIEQNVGLVDAARDPMLVTLTGLISYVSLHTADPGSRGDSEISDRPYTRQPITWQAPDGGESTMDTSDPTQIPLFDIPAATTITHVGFWDQLTGGTFYGSRPLSVAEYYEGPGTYTLAGIRVHFIPSDRPPN